MAEVKFWIGIAAAATLAFLVVVAILNPHPAPPIDNCKLTESQIREFWADSWVHTRNPDEQVRITKEWAAAAERMCRHDANVKPTPLPPQLKELSK